MTDHQQTGKVAANFGTIAAILLPDHQLVQAKFLKTLQPICGDIVTLEQSGDEWIIQNIHDRQNTLDRHSYKKSTRPLAANIDQVLIVSSAPPGIQAELIDHYLVAIEHEELTPVIVFNKADILDADAKVLVEELSIEYEKIGYEVIQVSAKTENNLDRLLEKLENRTSILVGKSGVGKSSIIDKLVDDTEIRIGELSQTSSEGKHTTTTTQLYPLKHTDGYIIDSPGVRQFGLWKLDVDAVQQGFIEFARLAEHCQFNNCMHDHEPGCAVRTALEKQEVSQRRYDSYLELIEKLK